MLSILSIYKMLVEKTIFLMIYKNNILDRELQKND